MQTFSVAATVLTASFLKDFEGSYFVLSYFFSNFICPLYYILGTHPNLLRSVPTTHTNYVAVSLILVFLCSLFVFFQKIPDLSHFYLC